MVTTFRYIVQNYSLNIVFFQKGSKEIQEFLFRFANHEEYHFEEHLMIPESFSCVTDVVFMETVDLVDWIMRTPAPQFYQLQIK